MSHTPVFRTIREQIADRIRADVHIYHGAMDGRVAPPQIIGHEASAEVAEIGEGVERLAVGDRVAVRPLRFGEPAPFDKGCSHVGKNLKFIGIDSPGAMQSSWTPKPTTRSARLVKRRPKSSTA